MWGFPKHIHSPHLTFLEFLQAYTVQVLDLFQESSSAYIPVWVWIFHKQFGCWYWFRVPPQHIYWPSVNETDVLLDRKLTAPSCMTALGWQSLVYTVNQLTCSDMTKQQLNYEQVDERWPSDTLDWEWSSVMYAQLIDSDTYSKRYDKLTTSFMAAADLTCWLMRLREQMDDQSEQLWWWCLSRPEEQILMISVEQIDKELMWWAEKMSSFDVTDISCVTQVYCIVKASLTWFWG